MDLEDELTPGLMMPRAWVFELRKLLDRINRADTVVNCLLAQERAEGVVQGLELSRSRDAATIERLYMLMGETAQSRLMQLQDRI